MLNDCRQQQQKLIKEALLELSKGLQHSCLGSDLKETCSTAEPLTVGLVTEQCGFTMSCSLNPAAGAPGLS